MVVSQFSPKGKGTLYAAKEMVIAYHNLLISRTNITLKVIIDKAHKRLLGLHLNSNPRSRCQALKSFSLELAQHSNQLDSMFFSTAALGGW